MENKTFEAFPVGDGIYILNTQTGELKYVNDRKYPSVEDIDLKWEVLTPTLPQQNNTQNK